MVIMRKFFVFAVLVLASVTVFAQSFSKEEQALIDLSNQKWAWMAEKNADKLAELFHDNAMFVHMGGSWGKQQEVDIIRGGMIWYKKADIHSQEVKFADKNTGTVYSNIHLTSEVGGHEVRFPFMVSEVYVRQSKDWKLSSLIFTKLLEPEQPKVPVLSLNNGARMPQFGIGTFGIPDNETAADAVSFALQSGYRHIDTAHSYFDEEGVGEGIRRSGVLRSEIWLTSKLWPSDYTDTSADEAIDRMLKRLGTDYVDLLYIHQPVGDIKAAYEAMIRAYKAGKVRALGISNFDYDAPEVQAAFRWIVDSAEVRPQVMQIECHPYAQRVEMRKVLAEKGIQLECWFPLGGAMSQGALFKEPVLQQIAKAHGKTPAQVIIRWHIQEGFSVIPGSTKHNHIIENISTMDFALSQSEMDAIRALNKEQRFYNATFEQTKMFIEGRKMKD